MTVNDFLIKSGAYPNLKGFCYIVRAVEIVEEEGYLLITKELYPKIAEEFNTTPSKVERAIRHIITTKIPAKVYHALGFAKKPTNGEFVYYFANKSKKN